MNYVFMTAVILLVVIVWQLTTTIDDDNLAPGSPLVGEWRLSS